jgi:hypothetical protein
MLIYIDIYIEYTCIYGVNIKKAVNVEFYIASCRHLSVYFSQIAHSLCPSRSIPAYHSWTAKRYEEIYTEAPVEEAKFYIKY